MFSGLPAKADFPILELTPAASFANATIAASRVAAQPCVGVQSSSWPKASVHSQGVPHRRCGRSHAADHDAVGESDGRRHRDQPREEAMVAGRFSVEGRRCRPPSEIGVAAQFTLNITGCRDWLAEAIEAIETGVFSPDDVDRFAAFMNALRHSDYYMVTMDFDAYFATQRSVERLWLSTFDWTRASLLNIAQMAWFSSDRTIGEYAQDIWKVPFELPSNLLGRDQEQAS